MPQPATATPNYARLTLVLLGALLAVRVTGILISPLNLGPDEAQYWRWGQTPAWGYFSKPPLIAWVIGAVTSVFGNAEWAVRLPAPFLHAGAAGALFLLARDMYDARTAAFAAFGYSLMPGVILSSGLMTTDGLLIPAWSLGLLCLWRLRANPASWHCASGLGLAIGLGFLAKYAMIYFLVGTGLAALLDPQTRRALLTTRGALAAAITLALTMPHVVWNARNGFPTFKHTLDNANLQGQLFNPENALTFLVDQMGIVGPVGFCILVAAIIAMLSQRRNAPIQSRWLLCFILPPLILIMAEAVTSRAHANWAASAYAAGCILIAAWLMNETPWPKRGWQVAAGAIFCAALLIPDMSPPVRAGVAIWLAGGVLTFGALNRWRRVGLLWTDYSLHGFVAILFMALATGPISWADQLGLANAFKRTLGWQATTGALSDAAQMHGAAAIIVDERENWHGLDYYGRDGELAVPVYTWQRNPAPRSYAEGFALPGGHTQPVLIASVRRDFAPHIAADFTRFDPVGGLDIPLYDGRTRHFELYLAAGYRPQTRGPDWEDKFRIVPGPEQSPASSASLP